MSEAGDITEDRESSSVFPLNSGSSELSSASSSRSSSSKLGRRTMGGREVSSPRIGSRAPRSVDRMGVEVDLDGAIGIDSLRRRERRCSSSAVKRLRIDFKRSSLASRMAVTHSYLLCDVAVVERVSLEVVSLDAVHLQAMTEKLLTELKISKACPSDPITLISARSNFLLKVKVALAPSPPIPFPGRSTDILDLSLAALGKCA